MNPRSFILSLLETPIGPLNWDDREFFSEIVEGYTSAYAMHKRNKKEYEKEKEEIQKTLNKIKEKADKLNLNSKVDVEMTPRTTNPSVALVIYSEKNNVDLIVVGTRGRTGFKKMLLGSVASGVVTYAHCPVLVI